MKYAFFQGCKIPYYMPQYGVSSRSVLETLGIDLIDIDFNCCGYPVKNIQHEAYLFSAARNMALAEKNNLNILTPCKCCFGSFKHANHFLQNNSTVKNKINEKLKEEGLEYNGESKICHMLTVLLNDIGIKTIQKRIKKQFKGLNIAAHYGCHALRPGNITEFDNPLNPDIFEKLIHVTGAASVNWASRLECCGNPVWGKNDALSINLMRKNIVDALSSDADYLCTACTYCQIQFDTVQSETSDINNIQESIPSILFPQLLGLCLDISEKDLMLEMNKIDIISIRMCLV